MNLRKLYDSSATYFANDWADESGDLLAHQFPTTEPITPALTAISQVKTTTTEVVWSGAASSGWVALNFVVTDPHYYAYQYDSTGTDNGAVFTATAYGDLDGDDTFSTFVRFGSVDNMEVTGSAGLYIQNELE